MLNANAKSNAKSMLNLNATNFLRHQCISSCNSLKEYQWSKIYIKYGSTRLYLISINKIMYYLYM